MKPIKWILLSVLFISFASIMLKKGVTIIGKINITNLPGLAWVIITNLYIIIGLVFYIISSFTWLMALSKTDLSKAYPILASTYAIIPLLSWIIFKEIITVTRWIGIATVCLGIMFMARS